MTIKILVVEDDQAIREMLGFTLKQSGFECELVADAELGFESLNRQHPDLILLDWMLPGMDGIEFIRRLRANDFLANIPVIMLTAKGESEDMVKSLSVGADDYVNKPFLPAELVARIRAVARRYSTTDSGDSKRFSLAGLVLDTKSHRVTVDDERVELGPTEFRLLHFFMKTPERAYSRGQLLDHVWGDTVYIEERTVDVHIRRLRKALEATGHDKLIQTVRGVGYRLSED